MQDPPLFSSVDGLTRSMTSWWLGSDRPGTVGWPPLASEWTEVALAGLDGRYVEIIADRGIAGCAGGQNTLWEDEAGRQRISTLPGELDRLWILDASRHVLASVAASGDFGPELDMLVLPLVIDATSQPGASPENLTELQAIIDSIEIEVVDGATIRAASGRLVYVRDGDIYLADADGANPVRVAPGATDDGARGPDYGLAPESIWARDGRHYMYLEGGAQSRVHISDAEGRDVACFANSPGFSGYPVWSPDSTRLQAWTDLQATSDFRQISIYGIDGALQTVLPLPDGYRRFRENLGVWAPDGHSVWVLIEGGGDREVWELPVDGSAPRRVANGAEFITFDLSFTRDGGRVAFSANSGGSEGSLINVANADGTGIRPALWSGGSGVVPVWSPDGVLIAYFDWVPGDQGHIDLKVMDVVTGTEKTLAADFPYAAWPPHSWSPDGDRILFSRGADPESAGLWTVDADGGTPTLLVEGATVGEWQPKTPGPQDTDGAVNPDRGSADTCGRH